MTENPEITTNFTNLDHYELVRRFVRAVEDRVVCRRDALDRRAKADKAGERRAWRAHLDANERAQAMTNELFRRMGGDAAEQTRKLQMSGLIARLKKAAHCAECGGAGGFKGVHLDWYDELGAKCAQTVIAVAQTAGVAHEMLGTRKVLCPRCARRLYGV